VAHIYKLAEILKTYFMKLKQLSLSSLLIMSITICQAQDGKIIENYLYKPTESEKARKYYNEAHDKFVEKDFRNATELYKKAILEDSNYIDAYDNLGLSFRQLDQLDSAKKYYEISHNKYPKGTVALQNLAVVEELKENFENAISYSKQIIAIEPENPEGYYGLCRMQFVIKDYDEALKSGQLAEKYYKQINSPYIGDCYYVLCIICYSSNNTSLAKKYLGLAKDAGIKIDKNIEKALK
jgi:tetratricopeptide (TPR) repeat protein